MKNANDIGSFLHEQQQKVIKEFESYTLPKNRTVKPDNPKGIGKRGKFLKNYSVTVKQSEGEFVFEITENRYAGTLVELAETWAKYNGIQINKYALAFDFAKQGIPDILAQTSKTIGRAKRSVNKFIESELLEWFKQQILASVELK